MLLGRVKADATGAFELRIPWTANLQSLVDPDGNLTVMVVAATNGEFTMGVNTVRYLPGVSRWAPAVAGKVFEISTQARSQGVSAQSTGAEVALPNGAGDDLKTVSAPDPVGAASTNVINPNIDGYNCYYIDPSTGASTQPPYHPYVADSEQTIAVMRSEKAGGWTVEETYDESSTTSNDVGYSIGGGGFVKAWPRASRPLVPARAGPCTELKKAP